jgi:hypothetical protein
MYVLSHTIINLLNISCYAISMYHSIILLGVVDERSQDSSVGIATKYELDGQGSIPGTARFSLLHHIQTSFGAHPASYPIGTEGYLPGE